MNNLFFRRNLTEHRNLLPIRQWPLAAWTRKPFETARKEGLRRLKRSPHSPRPTFPRSPTAGHWEKAATESDLPNATSHCLFLVYRWRSCQRIIFLVLRYKFLIKRSFTLWTNLVFGLSCNYTLLFWAYSTKFSVYSLYPPPHDQSHRILN